MREKLLYQERFGFDWEYPGACRNAVLSRFKWEALIFVRWCEGGDSNPYIRRTTRPKRVAATNYATLAIFVQV